MRATIGADSVHVIHLLGDFLGTYWQWLLGGLAACLLGLIQIRLHLHQTREARLRIRELEEKLKTRPAPAVATPEAKGVEFADSFLGFSYRDLILDSRELTVALNDGRNWIYGNRELLRDRLATRGRITRICLIHPESDYLPLLIRKNGKTMNVQLEEIVGSLRILREIAPPWADLEIRGHSRATPYCLYLTEHQAVVDPYFFFEAGSLPMITCCSGTDLYRAYADDARKLFKEAVPIEVNSPHPWIALRS